MTRRQRFLHHVAPFMALWLDQRRRTADALALLAERDHELAVLRARLAGTEAERAMAIATAGEWSAADVAEMHALGIDVER